MFIFYVCVFIYVFDPVINYDFMHIIFCQMFVSVTNTAACIFISFYFAVNHTFTTVYHVHVSYSQALTCFTV